LLRAGLESFVVNDDSQWLLGWVCAMATVFFWDCALSITWWLITDKDEETEEEG
jgi:hypothetical protein